MNFIGKLSENLLILLFRFLNFISPDNDQSQTKSKDLKQNLEPVVIRANRDGLFYGQESIFMGSSLGDSFDGEKSYFAKDKNQVLLAEISDSTNPRSAHWFYRILACVWAICMILTPLYMAGVQTAAMRDLGGRVGYYTRPVSEFVQKQKSNMSLLAMRKAREAKEQSGQSLRGVGGVLSTVAVSVLSVGSVKVHAIPVEDLLNYAFQTLIRAIAWAIFNLIMNIAKKAINALMGLLDKAGSLNSSLASLLNPIKSAMAGAFAKAEQCATNAFGEAVDGALGSFGGGYDPEGDCTKVAVYNDQVEENYLNSGDAITQVAQAQAACEITRAPGCEPQVEAQKAEVSNNICEAQATVNEGGQPGYSLASWSKLNGRVIDCIKNIQTRINNISDSAIQETERSVQSANSTDRTLAISEDCSTGSKPGSESSDNEESSSTGAYQVAAIAFTSLGSVGGGVAGSLPSAVVGQELGNSTVCAVERTRVTQARLDAAIKATTDGLMPNTPNDADPGAAAIGQTIQQVLNQLLQELQNIIFKFLSEMINRAVSFLTEKISGMLSSIPFLGGAMSNFVRDVGNTAKRALGDELKSISDNSLPDDLKTKADQTICGRTIYPSKDGNPLEDELYANAIDPRFIEYCNSQNKPINIARSFFDPEWCKDVNASAEIKRNCEIRGYIIATPTPG